MQKRTKIVATIGPATESEEMLVQLVHAGMNVARFNTKHNEPAWHIERMERVRRVGHKLGKPVAVLVDLQGPEIRTDFLNGAESFEAKPEDNVYFTCDSEFAKRDAKAVLVPEPMVHALKEGDTILIDDGKGEFVVVKREEKTITVRAQEPIVVKRRKTLNTPSVTIELPSLIEKDLLYIDAARNDLVDFVALSFVRHKEDIEILRAELVKRKLTAKIVAKIENQSAIDNIDEIIQAADAVMVARGDLGVEVPYHELARWQKLIIQKSRELAKPVITATQMLQSMVTSPRPSRAEVTDVSNAVYDGTDAVMLSDETTIGQYPVKAVAAQAQISQYTEQHAVPPQIYTEDIDPTTCITHAAMSLIAASKRPTNPLHINAIVCLTETGTTAKLLSRFREPLPIFALTPSPEAYQQMSLVYGVEPIMVDFTNLQLTLDEITAKIKELNIIKSGDTILIVHGTHWRDPGMTNTLNVVQLP
jgi:pyruvate kinase